jgi:hypothetical protein
MKADYIERESVRNFFGVLDRVDYFSASDINRSETAWRKGEQFLTRDSLTMAINYILELEADRERFTALEAAVMASPDAKEIFSKAGTVKTRRVAKNGSLDHGDELPNDELNRRRKVF